jgi:hypothetical protein
MPTEWMGAGPGAPSACSAAAVAAAAAVAVAVAVAVSAGSLLGSVGPVGPGSGSRLGGCVGSWSVVGSALLSSCAVPAGVPVPDADGSRSLVAIIWCPAAVPLAGLPGSVLVPVALVCCEAAGCAVGLPAALCKQVCHVNR